MFICFSLQFQLPLPVMILAFQQMALALETAESQGIMCCSCAIPDTSYRGRPRSPVLRSTTVFSGSLIHQPVLVWAFQIKKCKHSHPQPTFPLWSLHLYAVIIQHIFSIRACGFILKEQGFRCQSRCLSLLVILVVQKQCVMHTIPCCKLVFVIILF